MAFRVLYFHPSPTFGGASKSLIELFKGFPEGTVQATVICPRGEVAAHFRAAGMAVVECLGLSQWDNTRYGHYRGLRWLIVLRELFLLFPTFIVLYRTLRTRAFDLIHINEITLLPAAIYAKWLSTLPILVHVRSLQHLSSRSGLARLLQRVLLKMDAVIAIDRTVARSLSAKVPVQIIHNGIKLSSVRHAAGFNSEPGHPVRILMVGVLLKLKGVYEFVEAANICRNRGLNVEFLLAGENPRLLKGPIKWLYSYLGFAQDVRADLERYIQEKKLEGVVKLLGFVSDVQSLYADVDVLCFPSYLDAAGRPVFEAAFFGVPSLVAAKNPEPDTIIDGETGLCIAPGNPQAIADAVEYLTRNPELRMQLGENARSLAHRNFDITRNAKAMLSVYNDITSNKAGA